MPTERIQIIVTEKGARVVKRSIEGVGRGADRTASSVSLLNRALAGLASTAAITQLIRLSDTYTNLQNRIRTVTTGTAELNAVTQELFRISNQTRSSFENTAEIYARTALAVKDLGTSQKETLEFAQSLNEAIILSGAGVTEANNALIQFSQGLASGALRGDELRSVLEQLPVVADVIAKGLGVTRGELRALGKEGRLTAEVILNSFRDAREDITERFARITPTIGQSFQVLRNEVVKLIGDFDKAVGATALLSRALLFLGDNLNTIARIVAAGTITTGLVVGINAVRTAVAGLTAVIAANPIGALLVGITATTAALVTFSDRITLGEGRLANFRDFAVAVWEEITNAFNQFLIFFQDEFRAIEEFVESIFGDINISVVSVLQVGAQVMDAFVGVHIGAFRAIQTVWGRFSSIFETVVLGSVKRVIEGFKTAVTFISDAVNAVLEFTGLDTLASSAIDRIQSFFEDALGDFGGEIKDAFLSGFDLNAVQGALDRVLARSEEIARARIEQEKKVAEEVQNARDALDTTGTNVTPPLNFEAFQRFLKQLEQENELLKLNSQQRAIQQILVQAERIVKRELTQEEQALIGLLAQENEALTRQSQILEDLNGPLERYTLSVDALHTLLANGQITVEQFNAALREQEQLLLNEIDPTSFADGFISQMRRMQLETQNILADIGTQIAEIFGPGGELSQGIGDAVAEVIVFGDGFSERLSDLKVLVGDLAREIVAKLISSLVQFGVNLAIQATLGRVLASQGAAATTAIAAELATAWATPAALASLATVGANAAPATGAVVATVGTTQALAAATRIGSFRTGGHTGFGPEDRIAGVVHGREFVSDAETTRRFLPDLIMMQNGVDPSSARSRGINVVVNNLAAGVEFEVNQPTPNDIEIIARRVVQQEAPGVIASDLARPNSRTSKALTQTTTARLTR